jgi:hypothetical protein
VPDDSAAGPIAIRLSGPPPIAVLDVSERETKSNSCRKADAKKANPIREGESPPTNRNEIDKSRPESRREGSGDREILSPDQNDDGNDDEADDGGTDSDEDPKDDDYLSDTDAADFYAEERPRSPKRRRREKNTEDAVNSVSFFGSIDSLSSGMEAGSSIITYGSEEIPICRFFTLKTFESKIVYCFTFSQEQSPCAPKAARRQRVIRNDFKGGYDLDAIQSPPPESALRRTGKHSPFSPEEDALLLKLKEERDLPWTEIAEHFSGRTKGTLQMRYYIKLKRRPERPQRGKKRQRSN